MKDETKKLRNSRWFFYIACLQAIAFPTVVGVGFGVERDTMVWLFWFISAPIVGIAIYYRINLLCEDGEVQKKEKSIKYIRDNEVRTQLKNCVIHIGNNHITGCGPWIKSLLDDARLGYEVTPKEAIEAINKTILEIDETIYNTTPLINARKELERYL